MFSFALLSYPDWHESDKVYEEVCQAESTLASQVLQQHLNSTAEKWVDVHLTCVYGYMKVVHT